MALPSEIPRSFNLYVTHVHGEGHFLKLSGQLDKQSSLLIESLFESARENLEKGVGAVSPAAIHEGVICAAKYRDGSYYRAKVTNTSNLTTGLVGVHFIDYGNKDTISLSTIRFLDSYNSLFLSLQGQASDYYLSRIMHPSGKWEEPLILKLQNLICYAEYPATVDVQTHSVPIISLQYKGTDLSTHLVSNRLGVALPVVKQEVLLLQISGDNQHVGNWQPSFINVPPSYPEHVPFIINQNFPSNPASAMRVNHSVALPFNNGNIPTSSMISQRLQVNKVARNSVNLRPPSRQPQHAVNTTMTVASAPPTTPPLTTINANKPPSPKKSTTYKSRLLELNSQHKVCVSFADEGPELFAVQLVVDAKKLQDMMDDINRQPHRSLTEPPMIGTVCLGRMSGDRIICRAIVMNLSGSQCKLFFVDFGDTEMVSYYDIFDIPEEFVKPNVFAMRFCLSGVKKLEKGPHLTEAFRQLVNGKVLTLRVVAPEGPPLIQYGELYLDNNNILDLLMANMKDNLQFKRMEMLTLGMRVSILVSYVDSCVKFYIQLSDKIDELNAVMDAVRAHCENSSSPGELPTGAACCARFPDDDNWYRARVLSTNGNKVNVAYVDYGNEQEVNVSDLRTITPNLIKLPAQALKCALKGFENKPIETKTSNLLEMLALEKTLMAHIVGVLSNDTMLVSLVDDTVSPPLDVARRMTQLSQPRSNNEVKATTPVRKDAPESFSSPEGSVPDESRKKGFRREKSFKEERRPRETNDDFGHRGGSFRSRENKEGFDRSGPGRHSEKFGGRPERDRGERRSGPKSWESGSNTASLPATSPPCVGDDVWDDGPPPVVENLPPANRPHNRDNRDRRKPRTEHHDKPGQRPGWKSKDTTGVGKRLRQAVEAASVDAQNAQSNQKGSVQDRLKRENKFNHDENRKEDWGNRNRDNRPERSDRSDRSERPDRSDRSERPDRPDRRDNRGERRDHYGDKKEGWNQKREFRDNRTDRPKSNFTPRDRAERADRSFGSDTDKRSDKGYRSHDGRSGHGSSFNTRSKFTMVQYKELTDPVPLDTPFAEPNVEVGAQHEVSVTWIISPENFHTQILSLQPKFLDMMNKIPTMYKGVRSYTETIPVGASVLARYPTDGVLYRATVVSVQPFSKFIVRYVDFGNKQLVDAKDIWQLDRELMELPKMAVHCALLGVSPIDGEWKADPEIDLCFNAPRYQCVFQECNEEQQYKVSLWNNSTSVADMLVEKQLACSAEVHSSVTLKDEAIDLTIIVGQQILCRVTHVESFEKFYVQLDLEKASMVEEAIANFDPAKLTPLTADSLSEGIHCTVKHEGKIYRAILNDVTDKDNIMAVLPDYGNTIATTLNNLMILPTELSVYYYQSLQCHLNNYTSESKALITLEELKTRLNGNKFIVYINDVEEISLLTTLYDNVTGQKIAIFEPDEGAYDEVVQLCMRSVFNYNFGMTYISHLENLNEIYLQKAADGDTIAQLLDDLYKFYEEGAPEDLTSFEIDGLCAAKSVDGNWYRATIVSVEENEVKVQFPDYGNTEAVVKTSLKKLDAQFYEPCALALVASLGLVALQDDALLKLREWTMEKEVQVTLAFGSDGWLAGLHLDGVDLSMKLVNEKLATPQIISKEEQKEDIPLEEPVSLPDGCTQVYISHIDTPGHFWLQMVEKSHKIEEIQAELQANADNYTDIENREMGTLCIAKYLADDQWYRAEILDSDSDITTVRFTDYGNTDVLDNQPGLIKAMPAHLSEIERYAMKSSVNAVPSGTGQWSEPASEFFTQLVGDFSTPVDALIVLKDITTYVDIFVNGHNLTDKLVSEGYATRSEENECGDLPSCFASHVNSPSEFWIQLETATPELQAMENAMVDAENFPELTEREEGVICAAKYPEDGAWYRAQVIVDGSEGTEVLFMDYGNASIANELRSLPDDLKIKPALSRKCALQKPRDIKWSRKSEVKFNELAAEGATIFNVQFIASGDISIVELYLEGKSVTEELVRLCEDLPTSERPTPVGQDLYSSGKICYINTLEEFYVQLDETISDLNKVMDALRGAEEFELIAELKVGSICAAFWTEDEQWYRVKILESCDIGYHVQFIDYGNKAKCEDFRQLSENLLIIEPLAKCCRLAVNSEDSSSNEIIKSKLDDLAADESITFQIEFLDSTKEPILVKLLLNGVDVCISFSSITPDSPTSNDESEITNKISEDDTKVELLSAKPDELNIVEPKLEVNESENNEKTLVHLDSAGDKAVSLEIADKATVNIDTTDEAVNEQNISQPDLDESMESNHTVIENKSFEAKGDNLSDEFGDATDEILEDSQTSQEKRQTSESLLNSSDLIKSPERDESKDSINTDTGYTSDGDHDKSQKTASPIVDQVSATNFPMKESSVIESIAEDAVKEHTAEKSHGKELSETESKESVNDGLANETDSNKIDTSIAQSDIKSDV